MRHRPTRTGAPLAPRAGPASGLRGGGALDGGARIHVLHELGDIVVGGPLEDVAARARLHDAPAFEDGDLVAELQGLVEIVTDEEDGLPDPLLERQQLVLELAADERVERRERLVHEQDVRIGRERPREPDALRSEEHTSELQSHSDLVCRLLLEKKKNTTMNMTIVFSPFILISIAIMI